MGVGSQQAGQFEVMMHRHLAQDDGRGLGEGVLDTSRELVNLWFSAGIADVSICVCSACPRTQITFCVYRMWASVLRWRYFVVTVFLSRHRCY